MRIFRFDSEHGVPIDRFDSRNLVLSRIARAEGDFHVGLMHLDGGGLVGYHQATVPQLFMVIAGAGWVRGQDESRIPIRPFEAAFWDATEWHEAGTDTGMVALVVEAQVLDPTKFMAVQIFPSST